jgi:dipeptidyl aminopeptidase/acylaminoacyl peptidase
VLKIHGGPAWIWPDEFGFNAEDYSLYMAQQGYAVLMPNIRGSTGYGEEFLQGCVGDFCGMDFEDAMSGLDYMIERGIADPDRLGIMGWSYGGIFGSKALTKTDRFSAACLGGVGVNWISFYGTTDIPDFTELRYLEGTPYDNTEEYWNFGAMATISNTDRGCPVLIMQGEKDIRTPYPQALEYYRALKKLGATVELVTYTGQGHGLGTLDAQKDKLSREMAWLDKYLKQKE